MTAGTGTKLSYISAQFRVKLEFTRADCLASKQPPIDLQKRARSKMESIQSAGEISFYELYYDDLKIFWQRVAENSEISEETQCSFVLAEGCPDLKGFEIKPVLSQKVLVNISIQATPTVIKQWRPEWMFLAVEKVLKQANISENANNAQIHGCWLKATTGEEIIDKSIGPRPKLGSPQEIDDKPYSIIANKNRQEIMLVIRNSKVVTQEMSSSEILSVLKESATKVGEQFGGKYFVLKKEVLSHLDFLKNGPEMVGLNLPTVILGASTVKTNIAPPRGALDYPGAGLLNIDISDDNFSAHINEFDMKIYDDESFVISSDWLKKEIARFGIQEKASAAYINDLMKFLQAKENLDGVCVAEGLAAIGGQGPYLTPVYRKTAKDHIDAEAKTDLRSMQQRSIVKAGQLIAEIAFKQPQKPGWDLYGNEIAAENDKVLKVNVGEGVKRRGLKRFYATIDGVPEIDPKKNTIAISKVLIHKGDANLRSGNIVFDGPVEITGSVDGSIVEVTGDLIIRGSVRGGIIRVAGSVTVKKGIVTGKNGRVRAKGNVTAEFIENSTIECGGNLTAKKAILNSEIICGKSIQVLDRNDGVLAGGNIACREKIYTANLAFQNGASTELNVGVDWKVELKIRIRRHRLENLEKTQIEDRQSLRELTGRKNQENNTKVQEKKDRFQKRLLKVRPLIEIAQKMLEEAELQLTYNPKSKIFISEQAHANCKIEIGGEPAVLEQDMAGIAILTKRKSGSRIVAIEVGQRLEEEENSD